MVNRDRLVETFVEMARISSPSLKEKNVAEYIRKELEKLGMEVYEDNAGEKIGGNVGNIIGVLKGNGRKKIMLSAHMDTVLPCDKVTPIIDGNVIKSDGTTVLGGDDKAGIANIIEAIRVIKEKGIEHSEVVAVFSVAEEIGLLGAQYFNIEKYAPDFSFVLDSSGAPGVAIVQTPYSAKGTLKIIGKPAHAGIAPEEGINALVVASQAITQIKLGRIDKETTSNIGIVNGGEAVNIVMPEVIIHYEARSFSEKKLDDLLGETDKIFREVAEKNGAKFENNVKKGYAGYHIEKNSEILTCFKNACDKVGALYIEQSTGGGSDSNIYNEKGYPALTIGVGMSKVHTKEEFIKIEDLVKTTELMIELIKEMA